MEFLIENLASQLWYYHYFSGILLILLTTVVFSVPLKIRENFELPLLVLGLFFYAISRFLIAVFTILANPFFFNLQQGIQLLAVMLCVEFTRKNWEKAYSFKLSPLIHIPALVVFGGMLFYYGDIVFGTGAIPTTILVFILTHEIKTILCQNQIPGAQTRHRLLIWVNFAAIIQLLLSFIPVKTSIPLDLTWGHIFQLIAIVITSISILLFKSGTQASFSSAGCSNLFEQYSPIFFILFLLAANIVGFCIARVIDSNEERRIITRLEQEKAGLEKLINQRIVFATTSSSLISASPIISSFMENPTPQNHKKLEKFFDTFTRNFPDGICYLIDTTGLVTAASSKKEIFLGRYLDFRDYYKAAIAGKHGKLIDYGKFTNELGYYSAHPVYSHATDKIVGVCTVKRNLNDLNQLLQLYHPSLLLDGADRVFLASHPDYVEKNVKFTHPTDNPKETLFIDPEKFLTTSFSLDIGGWKVLLLKSRQNILQTRLTLFFAISVFSLALLAFFLGNLRTTEISGSLQLARNQFEALFYNAPEAIIIISPIDLGILSANLSATKLFEAQLINLNFKDLIPESGVQSFSHVSHDIRQRSFSYERVFKKIDGQLFSAEVNGAATVFNAEKAVLLFLRDITQRVKSEKELREAKNEAENASQIKGRFLANASHEIRTPMTAIIGLNELARKLCNNQEQMQILDLAASSARSLLRLLNEILDLSQIEAGKLNISSKPFNLRNTLDQLLQITALRSRQKNINTRAEIEDNVPEFINADEHRIRQILLNLFSNALKFTDKGEILLRVSGQQTQPEIFELNFMLKDTGEGISEEVKKNLFNAFIHTMPSSPDELRGTGLGLAISRQIIEEMNGTIKVESERGKGSTFYVTVPVKIADRDDQHDAQQTENRQKLRLTKQGQPVKILVADDNETNLFLASSIIKEFDGICECAANGEEVLQKIEEQNFDVLLLDIQMPVMDGITALIKIRESKKHHSMPVIALSAFSTSEEKKSALEAGANLYLAKPYFPEDLLKALDELLDLDRCDVQKQKAQTDTSSLSDNDKETTDLKQINMRELEARILNKPENILQIKDIFHRRSAELIENLFKSKARKDFKQLRETAHSIKGLSGMLAADQVYKLAQRIEKMAATQEPESFNDAETLAAKLEQIEIDLEIICKRIKDN